MSLANREKVGHFGELRGGFSAYLNFAPDTMEFARQLAYISDG